jgi:hypothetical protein
VDRAACSGGTAALPGGGGKCKGTGTVHLDEIAPKRIRYGFEGGGVTSRGLLRPARMSEWVSIFQEAGVQVNASSPQASK